MGLLVDFHYSDNWADPGQAVRAGRLAGFTTIADLRPPSTTTPRTPSPSSIAGGARPDMVQIGNESTPGILIHLCDAAGGPGRASPATTGQWRHLSLLVHRRRRPARRGPARRRMDQPGHALERGRPRASRTSTPASRSRCTWTGATTSPPAGTTSRTRRPGRPLRCVRRVLLHEHARSAGRLAGDVHRARHRVPEPEVHDRRVRRRAAGRQRRHLQSRQSTGNRHVQLAAEQPLDAFGRHVHRQATMPIYDQMKTDYAGRL